MGDVVPSSGSSERPPWYLSLLGGPAAGLSEPWEVRRVGLQFLLPRRHKKYLVSESYSKNTSRMDYFTSYKRQM